MRCDTEYIAIPKISVMASIAAIKPITPRLAVATRAGNKTRASASGQLSNVNGKLGSICARTRLSCGAQ
jgi:hypothetical protein